jgi:uncharacterized integral membrane protein
MATLVILLIILALVVIFSIQNAMPVAITFLFWKFEASLALVIFLSALCGIITGAIIMSFLRRKPPPKELPNLREMPKYPSSPHL